jgi:uncharacterized protein YecA (UPF0149 family)
MPNETIELTDIQLKVFDAINVLRTILHNEKASPSVRLRTALVIFRMTAKQRTIEAAQSPDIEGENEILHNSAQQPIRLPVEPGRNSQCPCGSGQKFKRCCGNPVPLPSLQTEQAVA